MTEPFDATSTLGGLTTFQRSTVAQVMDRYFGNDPTRRYLVADETGLGKSLVARGVIASLIERLQHDDAVDRIDIVYVCSNTDIAEQNLTRLNVTGEDHIPFASRLTLLAKESHRLTNHGTAGLKPVNLVSFTPGTSFEKGHAGGRAEERALLYVLLRDLLDLDHRQQRRAKIVLRHYKSARAFDDTIAALERHIDRHGELDPVIVSAFRKVVRRTGLRRRFKQLSEGVGQRQILTDPEWDLARDLIGDLRSALAKVSVDCLEPDLVILDEFQRFRHLLDRKEGGPAAELAHDLFDHSDARVLLLSATPYKPFTYAEERLDGDDHQRDFLATVRFLASEEEVVVDEVRQEFANLRTAATTGGDPTESVGNLRDLLLRLMCRTERPSTGALDMVDEIELGADDLRPEDLVDLAALRALARNLDEPFALEYWKSVPYFVNFSDGYRLGTALREATESGSSEVLSSLLEQTRHLDRQAIESGQPIDPSNARLRTLVHDVTDNDAWRLLWLPPSLPYLEPDGPFASPNVDGLTKRLIFSSWSATPTAIAAIVSHEAQRHTASAVTESGARAHRNRLDFRAPNGRPGAMTTLALFWPNPSLAVATDPLGLAVERPEAPHDPEIASADAVRSLTPIIGPDGIGRGTAVAEWYWLAPFLMEGAIPDALVDDLQHLTLALAGAVATNTDEEDDPPDPGRLRLHVDLALGASQVEPPERRPTDLLSTVARIGMHGPGNIALRALNRQLTAADPATDAGRWTAAATIASGFRTLFNRPDVAVLLDQLYPDELYWRAVLAYCAAGNLQAVLDEYLHHLAGERRPDPIDDDALLKIAEKVRDAVAMRPAPYTAFDPNDTEPISFTGRFAMRYGNKRQVEGDVRQPAIRNAFNSPFWPFVLATTSVGQEGIDFHWWCHAIVHWNTPASPVDFDQREGRIHRYGGHAIRKNVAARHRDSMIAPGIGNPWEAGYSAATEYQEALGDLSPHWVYPGPARVRRITSPYPLSIDHQRLQSLKEDVALYRLTLGQPRQEDMINLLRSKSVQSDPEAVARLRLDLSPPGSLKDKVLERDQPNAQNPDEEAAP